MNARSLLSLLLHGDKALDLVRTARDLGVIAQLDAGKCSLRSLVDATGARPLRMYKFMDGLETLGLVNRTQPSDDLLETQYSTCEPLGPAIEAVLGDTSIERERERYPWRDIHGRLPEVLAGTLDSRFAWPPVTEEDIRGFERAMAAGCPPIIDALTASYDRLFGSATRWLDVGGGDGTVMAAVLREHRGLHGAVFNLPAVEPLVAERRRIAELEDRMGFVGGDFLTGSLPTGYDAITFVRVLHDWPADVARTLLAKAREALAPGGRIIVCEEFRDRDRLAVQFFWTYFLIGVDSCVSRLREVAWYEAAFAELGCRDFEVIPGPFDVIVARTT